MSSSEFKNILNKIKVLENRAEVTYSVFIGDFLLDENLTKIKDALNEAFPSHDIYIRVGNAGTIEIKCPIILLDANKDHLTEFLQ